MSGSSIVKEVPTGRMRYRSLKRLWKQYVVVQVEVVQTVNTWDAYSDKTSVATVWRDATVEDLTVIQGVINSGEENEQ